MSREETFCRREHIQSGWDGKGETRAATANLLTDMSFGAAIEHAIPPADHRELSRCVWDRHPGNLPALTFPIRDGAGPFGVREDRLAQSFVAMSISPVPLQSSGAFSGWLDL